MYTFSPGSKKNIDQCDNPLQNVIKLALEWQIMDFAVVEGYRSKEAQNRFYSIGKSRVQYPNSPHNKVPSEGVDIVPWINGRASYKQVHCVHLAGIIIAAGKCLGVSLRWGGNWDMDGEPVTDQDFQDLVHYEKRGNGYADI